MLIKNDDLLIEFATKLLNRVRFKKKRLNGIRKRLRNLARVLLNMRKCYANLRNAQMKDIINPVHFKVLISTVRTISGYEETNHTYSKPSLAMHIGHDIKKIAVLCKSRASQKKMI